MPFNSPNHTQIPNDLFDSMLPDMGLAELKVTLAALRKTLGWQKRSDRISLTQMELLTGLSRQGVLDGAEAAEKRGTLIRMDGPITIWVVNLVDQEKEKVVKPVDHPSQASRPDLVKPVDTQKKHINKGIKEKSLGAKTTRPRNPLFDAIVKVCQIDPTINGNGSSIGKVCSALAGAVPPYTSDEVLQWGGAQDWRNTPPTVWQLQQGIGAVRGKNNSESYGRFEGVMQFLKESSSE